MKQTATPSKSASQSSPSGLSVRTQLRAGTLILASGGLRRPILQLGDTATHEVG